MNRGTIIRKKQINYIDENDYNRIFVISDLLGGGHSMLMGNLIQNQFLAARNWQFGSAISMILIAIILITMLVLNRYSSSDKGGALW